MTNHIRYDAEEFGEGRGLHRGATGSLVSELKSVETRAFQPQLSGSLMRKAIRKQDVTGFVSSAKGMGKK